MSASVAAVDLGASSIRYAIGWLEGGRIRHEVVRQQPNQVRVVDDRETWDFEAILTLCQEAAGAGVQSGGIDSWGVDHGFLNESGELLQPPVAYRDRSHIAAAERLEKHREALWNLTGIAHQPFNTVWQLAARAEEDPGLPERAKWLLLSDLLEHRLGAEMGYEFSQASTTSLMGLDGTWCKEAFAICGWPVPELEPEMPGSIIGRTAQGTAITRVASHDTASAVLGFGAFAPDECFLNVGTWSLLGCLLDSPNLSGAARDGGWTNERTHDGRVRFLKNIPGFYIVSRLHQELKAASDIPEWLAGASETDLRFDYFDEGLYNPESMTDAVTRLLPRQPSVSREWAGAALASMVEATASQPRELGKVVSREFKTIRVGGGGSKSERFCQSLANRSELKVVAGPAEATLLGNIALQLVAIGQTRAEDLPAILEASAEHKVYEPCE